MRLVANFACYYFCESAFFFAYTFPNILFSRFYGTYIIYKIKLSFIFRERLLFDDVPEIRFSYKTYRQQFVYALLLSRSYLLRYFDETYR